MSAQYVRLSNVQGDCLDRKMIIPKTELIPIDHFSKSTKKGDFHSKFQSKFEPVEIVFRKYSNLASFPNGV
jgi:hypothetical protein